MNNFELLEMFIKQEKDKAEQRVNTPFLMRHPEGMVDAFNVVLRKIKELEERGSDGL